MLAGALWRKAIGNQLLAEAPWRRTIGNQLLPRRCGEAVAGRKPLAQRTACRGGAPSGRACRSTEDDAAASGSQQAHTKREGPGRDLNISPEPLLFIALRKGYTPCDEAEPPFTACMQFWHALQAKLPTAFTAGMQCWRSCRWHAVQVKLSPAYSAGEVAAAIMQGLQGRLQQMQELRRALGIRQG